MSNGHMWYVRHMQFDPVREPLRMSEAIARQIEKQIHQGRLQADEMLPPENDLMKQFGVGRNTVREALRMLEASGLLKIKRGGQGGAIITHMSNEFVSDFLAKAFRLGGLSGRAFHDFRIAVEPSIAEMVAGGEEVDGAILARMEDKIAEAKDLLEANEPTVCANMDFHVLLAEATKNMMFIVLLKTLRAGLTIVAPVTKERFRAETIEYHDQILQAVKNREPALARDLMYAHLVEIGEVVNADDFTNGEGQGEGRKGPSRKPSSKTQ
jgi:GntR family transcriptional regulator, transcriptional repressor for pyruvate dehydrogenase complex